MPPALTPTQEQLLSKASRNYVQIALGRFAGTGATGWVQPTHSCQDGIVPRDFPGSLSPPEALEAVALRGPLHLIDGWGYLARALSALSSGSPHPARHLAYYAELRAALSILSSQGICIFNTKLAIIRDDGNFEVCGSARTHTTTWLALKYWASQSHSFNSLTDALHIGGVCVGDVFREFFPSPANQVLATQMIERWGFDLSVAAGDHEERNNSSYSLNELEIIGTTPVEDLKVIRNIWKAFQPQSHELEKHLLRTLLQEQVKLIGRGNLAERGKTYDRLDPRFKSAFTKDFLEGRTDPSDHPVMEMATRQSSPASAHELVARACILLRLALAMTEYNLSKVSVSPRRDLEFWWTRYGSSKGFWKLGEEPDELSELWYDVELALEDAEFTTNGTRADWLAAKSSGLPKLWEAERICLWGLCR